MHLLELARLAQIATDIARGIAARDALARELAEGAPRQRQHLLVLDIAGGGQQHAGRGIVAAHIVRDAVAIDAADDLAPAQDRPAHRLIRKSTLLEEVEDEIVWRVDRLADLLQDDSALALELVAVEDGVLKDIGENVDGEPDILLEHLRVIGRVLARGIGVQVPAHRLNLGGDVKRAAAFRTLEGHVLQEMGHAVDRRRLVARADIDPNTKRYRLDTVHRVGEDAHAALERGEARAHATPPPATARACARTKSLTPRTSFSSKVRRSGRSMRSARAGGSVGRTPVAPSTASG